MATQIFVNISVRDLPASIRFFTSIGYSFNPQFTNDQGGCLVISDTIYVMLVTEPFFKTFITTEICDTKKANECLIALSADSKASVDALVDKALKAGGREPKPGNNQEFMYCRGFLDLDGHLWEVFCMNPGGAQ